MRRFVICLVMLLFSAAGLTATAAAGMPQCRFGTILTDYICEEADGGTQSGSDSPPILTPNNRNGQTTEGTPPIYAPYERVVPNGGPNGVPCVTTGYREVPEGFEPGIASAVSDRMFGNLRAEYPECPTAPSSEREETSASYARRYWKAVTLPKPNPYIAPGRAITGLLAYLETRGATTHTYSEPNTPFGPLSVVATGKYYVDWGDGTRTGPHSGEGGPWPDGRITHEYIHIGGYDVVVTERWTATWSFGSESGVLDELRTVGRIEDFPVQQIQAVVMR